MFELPEQRDLLAQAIWAWAIVIAFTSTSTALGRANHLLALRDEREPSAFYFSDCGHERTLVRRTPGAVAPIAPAEVGGLSGAPDGFAILAEMQDRGPVRYVDVCSEEYAGAMRLRGRLRPAYRDLSDEAGWPKAHVRPGTVAIDPRYGRFKFYEGYRGQISLVKRVPTPHGNPFGLAAKGDFLFMGMGESAHGMLVIDAKDPSDMQVVAEAPRRGPWILDVEATGDLAFSSDARCVNIYDVADPRKPKVLCHHQCGAKYMWVDPDDRILYYRCGDHKILRRLDISDPSNPKKLPHWPRKYEKENSYYVVRHGKYAYLCVYVPLRPEEEQEKVDPPQQPGLPGGQKAKVEEVSLREPPADDGSSLDLSPDLLDPEDGKKQEERRKALHAEETEKAAVANKDDYYPITRIYDRSKDPIQPALIGELRPGHVIERVVRQGGTDYALGRASEPGLAVYDLTDPVHPKLLCVHTGVKGARTHAEGYIYSTVGHPDGKAGGLYIYEFQDVLKPPKLVGRLNTFDRRYMEHRSGWRSLLVRGDYAFVLDYFYGIVAIDVSDKRRPRIVGGLHTAGEAFCLHVSDTRAFVGENMGGLTIIDNTKPEKAKIVGNFGIGAGWGVAARGNIAFCANLAGLMIVDTTDPKNPIELSYVDGIYNALTVKVQGNYAYCMGNGGYGDIINVSDLRKPVRLGRFRTSRAFKLDVAGDYLYVADHREGLVIFDVRDKKHPERIATFKHGGGAGIVVIRGRYAFVGAPPGLQIVDISDPHRPWLYAASKRGRGGLVVGDYVYSTAYFGRHNLLITDISDPKNPRLLEGFDPGGYSYATSCALHGEHLYLASLPYLSICKVPMSSEAPRGAVTVVCDTIRSAHRARLSSAKPETVHAALKEAGGEEAESLSEMSARSLGLDLSLDVPNEIVPGFAGSARLALTNRGAKAVTFEATNLTSPNERVKITPDGAPRRTDVSPGKSVAAAFSVHLDEAVPAGEWVPLLADFSYSYAGSRARVRKRWSVRAQERLTVFERIPRLDVTNLDPCAIAFTVRNNATRRQRVKALLELPAGWVPTPGREQAKHIAPKGSEPFEFLVKLPDAEAEVGLKNVRLRLAADDKVCYQKQIDAFGERRMRWRIMGPLRYDVTSKERPIPEREVIFSRKYNRGRHRWRLHTCREGAAIDLVPPEDNRSSAMPSVAFYYGAMYLRSGREREVKLAVSADPAIRSGPKETKGWLNGKQVIGALIELPPALGEHVDSIEGPEQKGEGTPLLSEGDINEKEPAPPRLRKGWNLLLIRVCYLNNHVFAKGHWTTAKPKWPFRLAVHDQQGDRLTDMTFDSEKGGR